MVTNERNAVTKQTLTLLHEFYEILREYLHAFDCAPFPPGMKKQDYVPERMSRRFSAALTMPRPFMRSFLQEHGLNIPLLLNKTERSPACAARRLLELLREPDTLTREVPFLAIRCALMPSLLFSDKPRMRCTEHVRSDRLSIRRNRHNDRDFYIPRTREEWALGELVGAVMETEQPVFAHRVTGYDLFGERDLCALALPEWEKKRVKAVSIYATLAADTELWRPMLAASDYIELDEVVGLVGSPIKIPPRKVWPGECIDGREAMVRGELIEVEVFRRPRRSLQEVDEEGEDRRILRTPNLAFRVLCRSNGQLAWDVDAEAEAAWTLEGD